VAVRFSRRRRALLAATCAVGFAGTTSPAATIRDDVSQSSYASLGAESQYASSGFVYVSGPGVAGSGTLIAPGWILTAAHAVTQDIPGYPTYSPSSIYFGQGASFSLANAVTAEAVFVESGWDYNSPDGNDLALIELSTPITSVTPTPLYTSSLGTEIGQTATMVGYGYTGTGSTGQQAGTYGTRLGIQNVIDAYGGQTTTTGTGAHLSLNTFSSNLMFTDFDDPNDSTVSLMGSTTPLSLEGGSSAGDSGGGLFLTVNGTTYLAGVTDFGITENNAAFTASYGQGNGYTRVDVNQSANFISSSMAANGIWINSTGGTWATTADWSGGITPPTGGAANFTGAITSASTISLNNAWSIAALNFDNSHSYTLAPGSGGSLTLNGGGGTASITDVSGNHFISAPVTLSTNTAVTVTNSGNTLQISGAVGGTGGITLSGAGALVLDAANNYGGTTTVSGGSLIVGASGALPTGNHLSIGASGNVQFAHGTGGETVNSLSITTGGTLDLTNNHLILHYTGSSPVSTIRGYLITGYNSGSWNGPGIDTSAANASYGLGYADGADGGIAGIASGQIEVKYTLYGDTNLDGTVNSIDFGNLAANFGKSGKVWDQGDFDYNGTINSVDFGLLASNFGKSAGSNAAVATAGEWAALDAFASANGLMSEVPEPASIGMLLLGTATLLTRRRRTEQN
jgi:autotransporter-associated beta strand protein